MNVYSRLLLLCSLGAITSCMNLRDGPICSRPKADPYLPCEAQDLDRAKDAASAHAVDGPQGSAQGGATVAPRNKRVAKEERVLHLPLTATVNRASTNVETLASTAGRLITAALLASLAQPWSEDVQPATAPDVGSLVPTVKSPAKIDASTRVHPAAAHALRERIPATAFV